MQETRHCFSATTDLRWKFERSVSEKSDSILHGHDFCLHDFGIIVYEIHEVRLVRNRNNFVRFMFGHFETVEVPAEYKTVGHIRFYSLLSGDALEVC